MWINNLLKFLKIPFVIATDKEYELIEGFKDYKKIFIINDAIIKQENCRSDISKFYKDRAESRWSQGRRYTDFDIILPVVTDAECNKCTVEIYKAPKCGSFVMVQNKEGEAHED